MKRICDKEEEARKDGMREKGRMQGEGKEGKRKGRRDKRRKEKEGEGRMEQG